METFDLFRMPRKFRRAALILASSLAASAGTAGTLTLPDVPMATGSGIQVKPNILFILDDSGSMGWTHLPDHVENMAGRYGYKSAQCNGIYFNPGVNYSPPVKADGTPYPNAIFTSAKYDGFNAGSSTVDLSTAYRAYDNTTSFGNGADAAQPAYYYQYSGSQPALSYAYTAGGGVDTTTTFYKECNSSIGNSPGKNAFTKVVVSGAAAQQNFANWYSYYRVRIYTMKTAAGRAFSNLANASNYRIGFSTHSYASARINASSATLLNDSNSTSSEFQKIDDFCLASPGCTQRTNLYAKLYASAPSGGTPLREALSFAGRMYAGKLLTGSSDPIQYSCQQNFSILSTDGYWNGDPGARIDGSSGVGNQDGGSTPRPMLDSANKPDTLADVAMYYYQTDIRDSALGNCTGALGGGTDVCENNVPGAGKDTNSMQHMTTFTLGLGLDGTLKYSENYDSGGSSDFNAIIQGTKNWSDPTDAEDLHRIDDLWHAAVNGRGTYYSAKTPDALSDGLVKALGGVSARTGSAAAAATSNLEPVAGDNFAYVGQYTTSSWDGDLQARSINLSTGEISSGATWSAQALLDAKVAANSDSRVIYKAYSGALKPFTPANLAAEIAAKYFDAGATNPNGALSQYSVWSAAELALATPQSLINFIRGQTGLEDQSGNEYRLYRDRSHVLGDIVNSQPVYVKKPQFKYVDDGYSSYADSMAGRQGVVYVGGNDGMLHAFNADTGEEMWAFVPSALLPHLYKLADKNYAANHRFFVDGPVTVGDACFGASCGAGGWRTILVGGLGKGGRAYYALDITNPAAPSLLWEFDIGKDTDLGLSYGNPVITKRNGEWVVLFASGYNNLSPGDGKGRLYAVNAQTGSKILEIVTDSAADPALSGIAKVSNWVDSTMTDNSTRHVYGGDLSGNIWRFDIISDSVTQLASVGNSQPITTRPELASVSYGGVSYRVVYVGTGRYLMQSDISNTDVQSMYAIRDDLVNTYGNFRNESGVVHQTLGGGGTSRTGSSLEVNWNISPGWYVDFSLSPGERVNVDPKLQLGVLAVATNVPSPNLCNIGGYSWLYFFDHKKGTAVPTSAGGIVGTLIGNALAVGINVVRLPGGKTVTIATTSDNRHPVLTNPQAPPSGGVRRVLWRELVK